MLPFRIVSRFIRFPSVIDMQMARDQRRRHCLCKRHHEITQKLFTISCQWAKLRVSRNTLLINALENDTNYGKMRGRIVLGILDRSIINRKMPILRVYNKKKLLNVYLKTFHMNSFICIPEIPRTENSTCTYQFFVYG